MWFAGKAGSFSSQLAAALLVACLVGTAGGVLLGLLAVSRVDAEAGARQRRFAETGLAEQRTNLPKEQQSAAVWDEAVQRVQAADQPWIDQYLGLWFQTYFGHDRSYVLGPDDKPVSATRDGNIVPPAEYSAVAPMVESLVQLLRAEMLAVWRVPPNPEEAEPLSVTDYVDLGDKLALVSVTPIVPETDAVTQLPGTEFVEIAMKYLDAPMAARLAGPFELSDAAFSQVPPQDDTRISVPIRNSAGADLGWLIWTPDRPGWQLVLRMLPAIALIAVLWIGVLGFLFLRLGRASKLLHKSEAHARHLALHDGLTGLPNRALFDDRLSQALLSSARNGSPVSLLCIDLDRFKTVNDTLGHPAGDELIRQVAARLTGFLRQSDTVARIGGDEFAAVLTNMADDDALKEFCTRLIQTLSMPYTLSAGQAHIGASIGAVQASSVPGGAERALHYADIALYRAKSEGRSTFSIFTREMDSLVQRRHEIEAELRSALDGRDQFRLVYQPIYRKDGALVGAEALVRWNHPVHGLLAPEVFIGIAEESGLIHRLGRLVLERACAYAMSTGLPKVSVNISPLQLRSDAFAQIVIDVLGATGLPPERLELDLTEKFALDSVGSTSATLKRLRAAGVSIALDEFATGDSTFQYMREYSIGMLKIDRSFVQRLGTDPELDRLVQAVLDLARAMDIEVTADGIETASQRDTLIAMGCQNFQGFLMGKPMEEAGMAAMVAKDARSLLRIV